MIVRVVNLSIIQCSKLLTEVDNNNTVQLTCISASRWRKEMAVERMAHTRLRSSGECCRGEHTQSTEG